MLFNKFEISLFPNHFLLLEALFEHRNFCSFAK